MVRDTEKGRRILTSVSERKPLHDTSTRALMSRLWRESVSQHWRWLVLAVCFMAVMAASTAFSAWLMKPVVNHVIIARNKDILWLVSGAILATFVVKGLAGYAQSSLMAKVGLKVIADNQNRLFAHLARMDLAFFHEHASGKLISRFAIDINNMRVAVSNAITGFGKDFLTLLFLIVTMFMMNFELAVVSFLVFPVAVFPIIRLGKRMRKVTANTQEEMGLFTALLNQTFQGIRVVKSYHMEEYEKERIAEIVERIFQLTFKAARTRALSSPIMETLGGLAIAAVILFGGYQIIAKESDPGSLIAFITAFLLAYEPMKRLANLNASLQEGLAGAQRLFEMLDRQPNIHEKPAAADLIVKGGGIRLEDVHFAYVPGTPALDGVTLEVPTSKRVALVGPSGAGKSTILNLIPRFYDTDSGRVLIDGTDISAATFASLHSNIALVSQEIILFDDTVRANIAYGRAGASEEEIIDAARHAAADAFITELPQGYDTMVGEHGAKLSGGQRQRLAIARAMLKDAPILLLDEATSSLDTESERQVQAAFGKLMNGRTTLVIAHRLSTVVDADLIYMIDRGKVIERGSHAELIARGGSYARLYALQFAEQTVSTETAQAAAQA